MTTGSTTQPCSRCGHREETPPMSRASDAETAAWRARQAAEAAAAAAAVERQRQADRDAEAAARAARDWSKPM